MDQLKDFLRQCVKYRFWIAFGISLLLPIAGYFIGSGAYTEATTKREGEIKTVKSDVGKYTSGPVVNAQYPPIATQKKEDLTRDVSATWRKLFALQEPLLKWPEDVEEKFRRWGRKFPNDVDKGEVQRTLIDYSISYPNFVSKIYKTFKPFNFDLPDGGGGLVAAPDEKVLLRPAAFSADTPPELGKVWAEQERLWVVTALLDVVAKVNDSVGAKTWEDTIVKQLNLVEVGAQTDQDQVSIVKNQTLVPSDPLYPEGYTPPATTSTTPSMPGGSGPGGAGPMMMAGSASASATATEEVFYIKTEGQQYKCLPIKMIVLVDQAKLPDFLVGLENSPMTIQVMEVEIAKPLSPVVKPVYGEKSSFGMGSGMGGMDESSRMMQIMGGRMMMGGAGAGGGGMMQDSNRMMQMQMGMMGMGGGAAPKVAKKGTDTRGVNKQAERKKQEKEESKTKGEPKNKADQYFNIIEVTVYGQARFYMAPPPPPPTPPSTAAAPSAATPEPAKAEAPKAETPKAVEPDKKAEEPKKDETPKAETPKSEAPTPSPDEPKTESPKPEAPKASAPPAEAPKAEASAPKR